MEPLPKGKVFMFCGDKTFMNKFKFAAAIVGISVALAGCGGREANR